MIPLIRSEPTPLFRDELSRVFPGFLAWRAGGVCGSVTSQPFPHGVSSSQGELCHQSWSPVGSSGVWLGALSQEQGTRDPRQEGRRGEWL